MKNSDRSGPYRNITILFIFVRLWRICSSPWLLSRCKCSITLWSSACKSWVNLVRNRPSNDTCYVPIFRKSIKLFCLVISARTIDRDDFNFFFLGKYWWGTYLYMIVLIISLVGPIIMINELCVVELVINYFHRSFIIDREIKKKQTC